MSALWILLAPYLKHNTPTARASSLWAAPRSPACISGLSMLNLIAGDKGEAFQGDFYEPTMRTASDKGTYHLLKGLGHLDVVDAPETYAVIKEARA